MKDTTFVTKLQTITIQNVFTWDGRYGTDVIRMLSSSYTVATRSFQFAYEIPVHKLPYSLICLLAQNDPVCIVGPLPDAHTCRFEPGNEASVYDVYGLCMDTVVQSMCEQTCDIVLGPEYTHHV